MNLEPLPPFKSIRTRFLGMSLGVMIVTILIISILAVSTIRNQGAYAEQVSSSALIHQSESYLVQLVEKSAREFDQVLTRVLDGVQYLSNYTASVYDQPQLKQQPLWKIKEHMEAGPDGQYSNSKSDITSVFVPNFKQVDANTQRDIELGAYLELVMPAIKGQNSNIKAVYFATPNEVTRYFPNDKGLMAVLPPDFQVTRRVWYMGSIAPSTVNSFYWSTPYVDATGLGVVTTASQAVYDSQKKLLGVIGIDLTLNDIKTTVESMKILKSGYAFLIDKDGLAIALPEQGYKDLLNRLPEVNEFGTDISEVPVIAPVIDKMTVGEAGLTQVDLEDKKLFIAYAPLKSTGWSLGAVLTEDDVVGVVNQLNVNLAANTREMIFQRLLPLSIFLLILVLIGGFLLISRVVRPIQDLTKAIQEIEQGNLEATVQVRSNDELGFLAHQFQRMRERLRQSLMNIETIVEERTGLLEKRNTQLQAAAYVARETIKIRQLPQLLDQIVGLIGIQMDFYYVGIFLIDPSNEFAILQAAFSATGQRFGEKNYRYKVGQDSIVGSVASTGSLYVTDVQSEVLYKPDPLLLETRSELTLPLRGSQKMIGVLDIHSREEDVFSPEIVVILQNLADQVAVMIKNTRTLQEYQENLHRGDLFDRGSLDGTQVSTLTDDGFHGYQYDLRGVNPIKAGESSDQQNTPGERQPFRVPLKVRGETVANLDVWPEEDILSTQQQNFLNELSDRLSQAIDSSRLYADAKTRASRELFLNQFVSRLSRTLDLDSLMREAVRELGQLPGVKEASIYIRPAEKSAEDDEKSFDPFLDKAENQ